MTTPMEILNQDVRIQYFCNAENLVHLTSTFASPPKIITFVTCIDCRKYNTSPMPDRYYFPNISYFALFEGTKFFSKFDPDNAYYQTWWTFIK